MATLATAPGLAGLGLIQAEPGALSTLPDPRSRHASPDLSTHDAPSAHHPDLNLEVAALSTKLINAINYQTNLDDSLSAARQELDAAKKRIRQLEEAANSHAEMLASGMLVRKADVEQETSQLARKLNEERQQRGVVEKDKKHIEQELENLTSALFEEANKMVASARQEKEVVERRNDQLKSQLNDMEVLLASHQEQLAELKNVMQEMNKDRDDMDTTTTISTAPSTPALGNQDSLGKIFEALNLSPNTPGSKGLPASYPTSFTHLLQPVLRSDVQAFDEFVALARSSKNFVAGSRASSGSYGGLNVMGLGNLTGNHGQSHSVGQLPSNSSSPSLSTPGTNASSPGSPYTPASSVNGMSPKDMPHSLTPLKEMRFYKRAVNEDIEPTLRLDLAPGLSWLARRTVINTMVDGTLVVEPMPVASKLYAFTCSFCGECRKGEKYERRHRLRTSESENAQRYPLCDFCLERVRSTCEFVGFLRLLKDGHWRADDEEAEKSAWEQSVKLRERMFWARMGGGVVPAFLPLRDSPRSSTNEERRQTRDSRHLSSSHLLPPQTPEPRNVSLEQEDADPFRSTDKRVSIGKTVISTSNDVTETNGSKPSAEEEDPDHKGIVDEVHPNGFRSIVRDSLKSNASTKSSHSATKGERLSITIPGSTD